jgi:hypothetical protein
MGGKGSGRHRKPLSLVIEEVQDELLELDDLMHIDKDEAHLRINRLVARLSYHWKKLKKLEEYRCKLHACKAKVTV